MTEKLPPIFPHRPSPKISRGNGEAGKAVRLVKILCLIAVIFFFGYYGARAYYVTKVRPTDSSIVLKEFKGSYCCSCETSSVFTVKQTLRITPQLFLLPLLETSWNPFYVSIFWQPPDGSYRKAIANPTILDNFSSQNGDISSGYFYTSSNQIELITDHGHVTLLPIRWGETKFLVEKKSDC